jgi:hypothetical protein
MSKLAKRIVVQQTELQDSKRRRTPRSIVIEEADACEVQMQVPKATKAGRKRVMKTDDKTDTQAASKKTKPAKPQEKCAQRKVTFSFLSLFAAALDYSRWLSVMRMGYTGVAGPPVQAKRSFSTTTMSGVCH